MRIGTYNVLSMHGYPREEAAKELGAPGSEAQIERFSRVFAELDCDVLVLQEGGVPPATMQAIAQNLHMHLATFPSPGRWPGQALSRWRIVESRVFSHFTPDTQTPLLSRYCGAALIHQTHGAPLWVVGIHLHPNDRELRVKEAESVAQIVDRLRHDVADIVVLGDFNCEVHEDLHKLLEQRHFLNAMAVAGGGLRPTINTSGKKLRCIDHIYVSQSMSGRIKGAHVVEAEGFRTDRPQGPTVWVYSDHLPVFVDID